MSSHLLTAGLDHPPRCDFFYHSDFTCCEARSYRLEGLWQLHWYDYHAPCWIDDRRYDLEPGSMTVIPPGHPSRYRFAGRVRHLCTHLHLAPSRMPVRLPGYVAPHRLPDQVRYDFEAAIACSLHRPAQAASLVWSILWRLADLATREQEGLVDRACRHIEAHLGGDLGLPELAGMCGCSVNTLIRHFRTGLGRTPGAYIRQRRADRARHLLLTQGMPPREVAQELGFPDLQRFNKAMRAATGLSPRQLQSGR